MNSTKWLSKFFFLITFISIFIIILNYIVDPYGIYKTNFFPYKLSQDKIIRLIKVVRVNDIKPSSIILGNSRAEAGFDPEHKYFEQPSYNLAVSGGTSYESLHYLEYAIKQGNLKNVLLVADWEMFNDIIKKTPDFDDYFDESFYKYLFDISVLKNSISTIFNKNHINPYLENGLRYTDSSMVPENGHLFASIKYEKADKNYLNVNNTYLGTQRSSFDDFKSILEICYKNDINLEIIFGPMHIRYFETFDYYFGLETYYKWKKNLVLLADEISKSHNRKPFKIIDFSVYHYFTSEMVPLKPEIAMQYYWESSHYKKELGDIVLDRLLDISPYKDFGIELNSQNIDNHIKKLRDDREKYIDIKKYRQEVFGEN